MERDDQPPARLLAIPPWRRLIDGPAWAWALWIFVPAGFIAFGPTPLRIAAILLEMLTILFLAWAWSRVQQTRR